MEYKEVYSALARIKLLIEDYKKNNNKNNKTIEAIGNIIDSIEIPSKYIVAEGLNDLYREVNHQSKTEK